MRLRIYSDLHIEIDQFIRPVSANSGEIVVLAGDIGAGTDGIEWARQTYPGNQVIYVLGNHEFYRHDFDTLVQRARQVSSGTNVRVLENDSVDIGGVRFLGCSLWTDFRLYGEANQNDCADEARKIMLDYSLIDRRARRLEVGDTIQRCEKSRVWLQQQLAAHSGPTVVVTHHAATQHGCDPYHAGKKSNAAFHNDFNEVLQPHVRLLVHGHTHYCHDSKVGETRIVSNQRGYPSEHTGFRWDLVVDI